MSRNNVPRLVSLLTAAALAGCAGGETIPLPELAGAEREVARAVEQARRTVERQPDSASAWAALGDRLRAHRWHAEAARCYEQAARIEPEEFLWPYLAGHSLEPAEPERAARAFARAVELDGEYAPARIRYARALARVGRPDEARAQLDEARRIDPSDPHAEVGLGQLELAAGRHARAREHLERALRHDPRHAEALRALAQVELALGEEEAAARHAALAARLPGRTPLSDPRAERPVDPAGSVGHLDAGIAHEREGRLEEAAAEFRAAIAINPDNAVAHYDLGQVLSRLGKLEEAAAGFDESLRLRPEDAGARYALAHVRFRQGRTGEALAELAGARRLSPDDFDVRFLFGGLLAAEGRREEAIGELREAVRLHPAHVDARRALAQVLDDAGRPADSWVEWQELLARNPEDPRILSDVGSIHARRGRLDEARAHFRAALRAAEAAGDRARAEAIRSRLAELRGP